MEGIMTYRCFSCFDDLPEGAFQMVPAGNGKRYRRSICRRCTYLRYSRYQKKRVPIGRIRPYLEELVHRCGSERRAAKRLGITPTQLRTWRGKGRGKHQRGIHRQCAARVLTTLREERNA